MTAAGTAPTAHYTVLARLIKPDTILAKHPQPLVDDRLRVALEPHLGGPHGVKTVVPIGHRRRRRRFSRIHHAVLEGRPFAR